jgi:hypothetical protein
VALKCGRTSISDDERSAKNSYTGVGFDTPYEVSGMGILAELWSFMRVRKKFWLAPILIIMLLIGGLVFLTQGSAVAPFIYTLF